MNLNILTYKDFELKSFDDMKNLPSLQTVDISDHAFRDWQHSRAQGSKTYLLGPKGIAIEIRPVTMAANQDLLYAVEECLNEPSEIWQSLSGDLYTHAYVTFYGSGALVVSVSFADNQPHRVASVKFIKNANEIRKGTLYHG